MFRPCYLFLLWNVILTCLAFCLTTVIAACFLHLCTCLTCSSVHASSCSASQPLLLLAFFTYVLASPAHLYMPHLFTRCLPTIICVMLVFTAFHFVIFFVCFSIFAICYISSWLQFLNLAWPMFCPIVVHLLLIGMIKNVDTSLCTSFLLFV